MGGSSHFGDYFFDECTFLNVYPWQEPAGSSDQVQALDLGIFGIQKKQKSQNLEVSLNNISISIKNIVNS